ncbi:hypothetical protein HDU98_001635 [Podochytrium sp. JEL0797]|nr:hypothetical protein HDU98_001635 [Podochytrium sp. JEL0797]
MKPARAINFLALLHASKVLAAPIAPAIDRRQPNRIADVIHAHGLEMRHLERRASKFSYEGASGPSNWANLNANYTVCQSGKYQSPINFQGESLAIKNKPVLTWSSLLTPFDFLNTGYTVQLQLGQSLPQLVSHEINGVSYTVSQMHFHSPSEHHVEDKYFPLEAHFVHTSSNKQMNVIALFFTLGHKNEWIQQFIHILPRASNETTRISSLDMSPIISALENASFFSYIGSLSMPPCTEGVLWLVAREPLEISVDQLTALMNVMPFNSRPTQDNKNADVMKKGEAPRIDFKAAVRSLLAHQAKGRHH